MLRYFCNINSSFIPTVSFVISLPSCHVPPIMVSFNQLDQWGSGLATDPCASLSVCITVGFCIYVQRKAKLVTLDNFKFLTPTALRVWAAPMWPSFQGPKAKSGKFTRGLLLPTSAFPETLHSPVALQAFKLQLRPPASIFTQRLK